MSFILEVSFFQKKFKFWKKVTCLPTLSPPPEPQASLGIRVWVEEVEAGGGGRGGNYLLLSSPCSLKPNPPHSKSVSAAACPQMRSNPAGLVYKSRLRANSGKQDGRDFNNRSGERGRQPTSFRSCVEDSEHPDQKAAQVASALPRPLSELKTNQHGYQTEGGQKQIKVNQTRVRMVHSQDDHPSKSRGKQAARRSQQGREQPKPWRKQMQRLRVIPKSPGIRTASSLLQPNGLNNSRSPSKRFSVHSREEDKRPATRDKPKRSKLKDELSIINTATEIQGQEVMMTMKHVDFTIQGDRITETRTMCRVCVSSVWHVCVSLRFGVCVCVSSVWRVCVRFGVCVCVSLRFGVCLFGFVCVSFCPLFSFSHC